MFIIDPFYYDFGIIVYDSSLGKYYLITFNTDNQGNILF